MIKLPFGSLEEANENITLLKKSFRFCMVRIPDTQDMELVEVGHQRTQEHVAKAFGFCTWKNFAQAFNGNYEVDYFNPPIDTKERRSALATKLSKSLNVPHLTERIERALAVSAFGCTHSVRFFGEALLNSELCKNINVEQWDELQALEAAHRRHSRYNHRLSTYEIKMNDYWREKAIAKILGNPPPRKPYKPRKT